MYFWGSLLSTEWQEGWTSAGQSSMPLHADPDSSFCKLGRAVMSLCMCEHDRRRLEQRSRTYRTGPCPETFVESLELISASLSKKVRICLASQRWTPHVRATPYSSRLVSAAAGVCGVCTRLACPSECIALQGPPGQSLVVTSPWLVQTRKREPWANAEAIRV